MTLSLIPKENKRRQGNFELLRIISMFFIVVFHFNDLGGISNIQEPIANKLVGFFISIFGNLGNNLFILISGYFLINSKFKTKKLLKIYFEIYFYSVGIALICHWLQIGDLNKNMLKQSFVPIIYNMYWFATTYIGMYILSPYINKLIKTIDKRRHETLIIILGIMLSVIPSRFYGVGPWSNSLIWFIYLYIIAAYINLYNIRFLQKKKWLHILLIILVMLTLFSISAYRLFENKVTTREYILYFIKMDSIFMLTLSLLIFLFFKNINITENKVIRFLSKSSFAVYLIHINSVFRGYLFYNILKIQNYYNANTIILILYILGTSGLIYILCSIIDFIRRIAIEEPIFKIKKFDKYFDKIDNLIN